MADWIEIRGVRAVGRHGVLAEEQTRAQPFEVDVRLQVDLLVAGRSDDLDDTVDYGALTEIVVRVVESESYALLERLAARIADEAKRDERVQQVEVTVRKLRPPIPAAVESVAVTITR